MKIVKFSYMYLFFSYILFYIFANGLTQAIKWSSIFFLLIILLFCVKEGIPRKDMPGINSWIFLFFFNILCLITSMGAIDFNSSIKTLVGLNLYFVIYYLGAYKIGVSKNEIVAFNNIIIIISLLFIFYAYFNNPSLTNSQFHTYFYERIRVFGTFIHPNYLGGLCFVNLIASFINWRLVDSKKRWYVFSIILFACFLVLSDSRGGLYSFLIFLAVFYFQQVIFKIRGSLLKVSIIVISAGILIGLVSLLYNFLDAIVGNRQVINSFTSGRIDNWDYILHNFILSDKFQFFFGHGLSSVQQLVSLKVNTDNGFLVMLYEIGLFSSILIIFLLIYLLIRNLVNNNWSVFGIPVFCSYITYTFFENFLLNFGHIVPFYCWSLLFIGLFKSSKEQ
ncbi:O-antigen ligase family protein [Peribacillus frigoritolerans]|uniref:O-antigen ligase family protein n=1 Tax=Peribacillus frigoritolerans TaxID=450367 RepID=UPI002E2318F0|nr:O-antigen ligase family protein [Peribacillus frigoritolerans]